MTLTLKAMDMPWFSSRGVLDRGELRVYGKAGGCVCGLAAGVGLVL